MYDPLTLRPRIYNPIPRQQQEADSPEVLGKYRLRLFKGTRKDAAFSTSGVRRFLGMTTG